MGGNHVDDIIIISSDEDEELSSSVSPFCRVSLFFRSSLLSRIEIALN